MTLQSPLYPFMYALKSSEAKRQYPKRLKMLFDYLKLPGLLEEQAKDFLDRAREKIGLGLEEIEEMFREDTLKADSTEQNIRLTSIKASFDHSFNGLSFDKTAFSKTYAFSISFSHFCC